MLYLYYGNDQKKSEIQFKKLVDSLRAKRPDAPVFRFEGDSVNFNELEEIIFGASLFDPKYLIILKNFTATLEGKDFFDSHLADLAKTDHIVLVLEGALTKPLVTKFTKHAERVQEYNKGEAKEKTALNIFALADALGERDKKKLWILYQEALASGVTAEEIFWRLVGQVKNMLIVGAASNQSEMKMHPFVLRKTTTAAKRFSLEELQDLSRSFLALYSDARYGKREFEVAIERMILGL